MSLATRSADALQAAEAVIEAARKAVATLDADGSFEAMLVIDDDLREALAAYHAAQAKFFEDNPAT